MRRARAVRRSLAMAAACAMMVSAPPLAATPEHEALAVARELFLEAMQLEEAQDYARALATLRRVAAIKMSPSVRTHMAFCLERTGKLAEALTLYEALARDATSGRDLPISRAASRAAEALRPRVPRLTIRVPERAPDLRVLLDDAPLAIGLYGEPLLLDPGAHRIEATAARSKAVHDTVTLVERAVAVYEVRFAEEAVATATPAATARSAPPISTTPPPAAAHPPRATRSRALPIATTVTAGALLTAGISAFLVAGGKQRDGEEACRSRVDCEDLREGPRVWDALAIGAFGGAAIAGGLSVYLWSRPARADAARLEVGPGAVHLRGRF